MMNFRTGQLIKLTPTMHPDAYDYTSWSPDSHAVALWQPHGHSIEMFDRSGHRLGSVRVDLGWRQVFMSSRSRVTVFNQAAGRGIPRLRFTTYDLEGQRIATTTCALPSGYPSRATGVDGFDDDFLSVHALVDSKRWTYRYSTINTSTGAVIDDIEYRGAVPYIQQRVRPGIYMAGISGAPDGIYGVSPDTSEMVRLSQLNLYQDQAGYENHANSQFATDLILDAAVS